MNGQQCNRRHAEGDKHGNDYKHVGHLELRRTAELPGNSLFEIQTPQGAESSEVKPLWLELRRG
jgi:hypothetical protein